jgi:hypothetical protein
MKASQVIATLAALIEEYGDLPVMVIPPSISNDCFELADSIVFEPAAGGCEHTGYKIT